MGSILKPAKPKVPKIPPPPPPPEVPEGDEMDPLALEQARLRANEASQRTNRNKLRIPLGTTSPGTRTGLKV